MNETQMKMENTEIKKLVLTMSLPIIISMVIQALYNIVDSIFVAKVSPEALTAVSLCYPVQTVMVAVACGTAVGFNTLLARYMGQKKMKEANNTLMHGLMLGFLNGIIFAVLGLLFSNAFLSRFTSDSTILSMGNTYIRICTVLSFSVFIQIIFERIMQATGNAMYNMVMQAAGAIINIILDPIFIFGYFGLPAMDVKGAAIATVTGQICAMLIGYGITKIRIKDLQIKMSNFKFSAEILKRIYQVGIPAILMQSVLSFMTVFMNMILASFSTLAISVFSVYYKLQQFVNMAVLGITNALIPILSYNYGAKRDDRVKEAIHFSLALPIGIMFVGTVIFQLFPRQLMSMFSANSEMYSIGMPALKEISLSFVFAGISMILCSCFQALNHANESLWITLGRQLVILLPITYFLMHTFGMNAGWYAFVITEIICALASIIIWKKITKVL